MSGRPRVQRLRNVDFELDEFDEEMSLDDVDGLPDFRASIRDGRLTLVGWYKQLFIAGPSRQLAAALDPDVSLVDMWVSGQGPEQEVTIAFRADGDRDAAERTLTEWARVVGYRRLWLPDRVEELDGLPALAPARTKCSACETSWAEESPDFWKIVVQAGHFPAICPLCGGDLPQWRVDVDGPSGARTRSVSPAVDTRERP